MYACIWVCVLLHANNVERGQHFQFGIVEIRLLGGTQTRYAGTLPACFLKSQVSEGICVPSWTILCGSGLWCWSAAAVLSLRPGMDVKTHVGSRSLEDFQDFFEGSGNILWVWASACTFATHSTVCIFLSDEPGCMSFHELMVVEDSECLVGSLQNSRSKARARTASWWIWVTELKVSDRGQSCHGTLRCLGCV